MFIELVDALRCPHPHQETWLVAATAQMAGRDIMTGKLGCPICHATFPIVGGVVRFGDLPGVGHQGVAEGSTPVAPVDTDEAASHCAALLDLTEPGGFVVLTGGWATVARPLSAMTGVAVLVVNPPADLWMGDGVSGIQSPGLPLGEGLARGAALDGPHAEALLEAMARAVKPGGRILAPADVNVPLSVTELARDERHWVGARGAGPDLIPLGHVRRD